MLQLPLGLNSFNGQSTLPRPVFLIVLGEDRQGWLTSTFGSLISHMFTLSRVKMTPVAHFSWALTVACSILLSSGCQTSTPRCTMSNKKVIWKKWPQNSESHNFQCNNYQNRNNIWSSLVYIFSVLSKIQKMKFKNSDLDFLRF